ncbi:MAG: ABC transporter permease [Tannerellaceae bacterium]|jgi:putative ABC transport system permease protein|nr:ABC transporter permease [Tannerellaceae bacterium]
MFDLDKIQEIWITITRNRVRSLLTAFGVFWGIFTLVVMIGSGDGLERGVMKGVKGFATNSCFLGSAPTAIPYKGFQKGRAWNIQNKDIDILMDSIPEIKFLSPVLLGRMSNNNIVYEDQSGAFHVKGLYPNYAQVESQHLSYGRFINDLDIEKKRKVCVIGEKVFEKMFPRKENPIGQDIRVNGVYYQIVGVTKGLSDISIGDKLESSVLLPFTTLQQINNQGDIIHFMAAISQNNIRANYIENRIKQVLKSINHIHPDDYKAIWSFNMENEYNMYMNLFSGVSILIWIVGLGTLIAGIVGVCNIMLITVKERTREIGVRRAIGAKPRKIISQIMWESIVLTLISGVWGLCAGVYTLHIADMVWVKKQENMFILHPMITFKIGILSLVILLISGVLAGIIPAMRALNIKAIDAIREE